MISDNDQGDDNGQFNQIWAAIIVDACRQQGATDFFLAPGSRCTPLTIEVARLKSSGAAINVHQHFDERGLALACVGFGKAAKRPGVFICTSGTAVANAFPAVIESAAEDVPMIVLAADRPPELRGTGANQTIDQINLFGNYPRSFLDLDCPDGGNDPRDAYRSVATALAHAKNGPVHINCIFREPFDGDAVAKSDSLVAAIDKSRPAAIDSGKSTTQTRVVLLGGNTLIIASGCHAEVALAAQKMAERLRCPFLADVTSGLRSLAYDYGLVRLGDAARPKTVIHVGRRITSKRLLQFLETSSPKTWLHINETTQPIDPTHQVTKKLVDDAASICDRLQLQQPSAPEFLHAWKNASATARRVFDEALGTDALSEPTVAHGIAKIIPDGHGLFLGNSMPVRDMDAFGFWKNDRSIQVAANRGASGIDGTIATACGFAAGIANTTTAVIGDLAALHDLNALSLVSSAVQPIVLVIINNDGGGIFHFLPIRAQTDQFEEYFGTPHGHDFRAAAEMFKIEYVSPTSTPEFNEVYTRALDSSVSTIIEVTTNRTENATLHRRLLDEVANAPESPA